MNPTRRPDTWVTRRMRGAWLVLWALAGVGWAQTNYVATTGSDTTGDGTQGNPWLTLSHAIAQTPADGTILVATGEYAVTSRLLVDKALTVRSWEAGAEDREHTVIQGDGSCLVVYLASADARVSGFTLTKGGGSSGSSTQRGGALEIAAGTVSNCIIRDNSVTNRYGAGVYMRGSDALLTHSRVISNTAWGTSRGGGAGVFAVTGAVVTHTDVIANRLAEYGGGGGGLYLAAGCIFAGYGGGVYIYNHGTSEFYHCEIASNTLSGYRGAGMNIKTGSACVVVQNCLVAGNKMQGNTLSGGGLYIETGVASAPGPNPLNIQVESCTIVDNWAATNNNTSSAYGGLRVLDDERIQVWNTVVASNRAYAYPDLNGKAAFIAPIHYSCSPLLVNAENGNLAAAPSFADPANGNYRLAARSPGLDAGTNQEWMLDGLDLDGRARLDAFMRRTDMGAYEAVPEGMLIKFR